MRLVTFSHEHRARIGALVEQGGAPFVLDFARTQPGLPSDMLSFLMAGPPALDAAREALGSIDDRTLIPMEEVGLLAPVPRPGKILCLGHNYRDHIGIGRTEPLEYPTIFGKTANTIVGPDAAIEIPAVTAQVDFEGELAVIVGVRAKSVSEAEAMNHVAGYAVFNDVSARDYQKRTSQWMLGKSFDTFGPLGPALVTRDEVPDPHNLELELCVNGEARQHANTRDLIFTIPYLVAYLSAVLTLEPGDVIATGTPAKLPHEGPQRFLQPGDRVSVTIEKLGSLNNPMVAAGDLSANLR